MQMMRQCALWLYSASSPIVYRCLSVRHGTYISARAGLNVTSVSRIPPVITQGEFDFLATAQVVWQQKKLIVASSLMFAALGAIYAFTATPEYETSAALRSVPLNDLDALNRSGVYSLSPDEALMRVASALDSYEVRLGFYQANPQLQEQFVAAYGAPAHAFERFNRDLQMKVQTDVQKPAAFSTSVSMQMRYPQGINGPDALNGLIEYAIDNERRHISDDLKVIVSNRLAEVDAKLAAARSNYDATKQGRIAELLEADRLKRAQLQDELKALRAQLKLLREDRIAQLNEAITIARSLGLKRPSTPSSMANSDSSGTINRTEVTNQQIPLYFMGVDALEAERQVMRRRESDDFSDPKVAQIRKQLLVLANNREVEILRKRDNDELFLKGIESLRAERARLEGMGADASSMRLVSIDQPAVVPVAPVQPKKLIVILMGLVVGGVFGIFLAIMRNVLVVRRLHLSQEVSMSVPVVTKTQAPSLSEGGR